MKKNLLFCCCLLTGLVLNACVPRADRVVDRSFYFWKSRFDLSSSDVRLLDSLRIHTLYVKFFDVDLDVLNRAVPIAKIEFATQIPDHVALVPTVFITNRTLQGLTDSQVDDLATKIRNKIFYLLQTIGKKSVREIQLDCDWSGTTKDKYFRLLKHIKGNIAPARLSATIRLHQLKYATKTGIPPVDKGMLMCYNMTNVNDVHTANSILDMAETEKYLDAVDTYPLPLDMALPVFSWAVLFRNNRFLGILNNIHEPEIKECSFLKKLEAHTYVSLRDTVYEGIYLRNGDRIRVEEAPPESLLEAADALAHLAPHDTVRVSFFHWDIQLITTYRHDALEEIYSRFH